MSRAWSISCRGILWSFVPIVVSHINWDDILQNLCSSCDSWSMFSCICVFLDDRSTQCVCLCPGAFCSVQLIQCTCLWLECAHHQHSYSHCRDFSMHKAVKMSIFFLRRKKKCVCEAWNSQMNSCVRMCLFQRFCMQPIFSEEYMEVRNYFLLVEHAIACLWSFFEFNSGTWIMCYWLAGFACPLLWDRLRC